MLQLSAPQATLAVAGIVAVSALIGWFGRGLVFLLHRWWTGAPKQERATYLNSVADLAGKLRSNGMSIEDVRQFEAIMQNPTVVNSHAMTQVVEDLEDEPEEPVAFHTNFAMKRRAAAAYGVADAHLQQALEDLRLLLSDSEDEALDTVQERWAEYRTAMRDMAELLFEGGTHAPLFGMMTAITETERRTAEVRASVEMRSKL